MGSRKFALVLLLTFFFVLVSIPYFPVLEANPTSMIHPMPEPAFIIRTDGSIEPSTAPLHRDDNIYTLTDNIVGHTIIVERNNIVLNGGGYSLKGNGFSSDNSYGQEHLNAGLFLMNRQGVTVRNMKISGF